ncbi:MAG: thiamine-monophosphate kinase [Gemmatimonadetes bacterium]|nr:thiamine-monophosphate kinase [Gemmatimonadota bacterium]
MSGEAHLAMGGGEEFDAIRRMLSTWGAKARGIGDDAAVLEVPRGEKLVVSTDAAVEDVHFKRPWLSAMEIGARAASAALSDLAAMAATPRGLLLAVGLPADWHGDLEDIARGVGMSADYSGCPIIGGNLSASHVLSLTITVLGSTSQPLHRNGARPGDVIFVTGQLGGPRAALAAFTNGTRPAPAHRMRFASPKARLRESYWLAARGARAAIDISDGLVADAEHIALASGVSIEIDDRAVPLMDGVGIADALASGEEYELLVAMPQASVVDVRGFAGEFGIPLTAIGVVTTVGDRPVTTNGTRATAPRGHDHLA